MRKETGRESFHSFFWDIMEARLYARGHLGWNKTLADLPSTTPEIITPPSELIYWRSLAEKLLV